MHRIAIQQDRRARTYQPLPAAENSIAADMRSIVSSVVSHLDRLICISTASKADAGSLGKASCNRHNKAQCQSSHKGCE